MGDTNTNHNDDYRQLIDERFGTVHEKLDTLIQLATNWDKRHEAMDARLRIVENRQLTCPVEHIKQSLENHKEENKKEIEEIWKVIEDVDYFKRHPNQFKYIAIGIAATGAASIIAIALNLIDKFV